MFGRRRFETEVVVHKVGTSGPVVECVLRGSHGDGVAARTAAFLKDAVEEHRPNVLVLNLLDFRYRFGNDIAGALVAGFVATRKLSPSGNCRILASGGTARALRALMEPAKVFSFFGDRLFADLPSAVADAEGEASHELST